MCMETLYQYLRLSKLVYYTDLILAGSALIATTTGIIFRQKHRELRYMFIYPFASFLQQAIFVFSYYWLNQTEEAVSDSNAISINLFLLIEFSSISLFYFCAVTRTYNKRILRVISIFYGIFFSIAVLIVGSIEIPLFKFFVIQSVFICGLVAIHLRDSIQTLLNRDMTTKPGFWVSSGALVCFLGTLPIYTANRIIFDDRTMLIDLSLYSINYACYAIFFLFITRAYLCNTVEN
jgi:hypothetical protein